MARPWIIQYESAIHYIMSIGVGGIKIFHTNDDYFRFLEYVEKARKKFGLDTFVSVLVGNHYHMLIRTNEPNLSRTMQWNRPLLVVIIIESIHVVVAHFRRFIRKAFMFSWLQPCATQIK